MIFELTMTNLISLAGLFLGALWGLLKVIGLQAEKRANEKFAALQTSIAQVALDMRREADAARLMETSFLRFQAEMPLHYVRREDYIRGQSVIEAKLDALGSKLETAQLRAATGGNHAN